MRFWDSSALVPLVLEEARSPICRAAARGDRDVVVWMFTEILAAIHRAWLAKRLDDAQVVTAERRLGRLARAWKIVVDAPAVKDEARDVIRRHRMRTADALQLAAARLWANGRPKGRGFVTADHDLARAAEIEGFDVRDLSPS